MNKQNQIFEQNLRKPTIARKQSKQASPEIRKLSTLPPSLKRKAVEQVPQVEAQEHMKCHAIAPTSTTSIGTYFRKFQDIAAGTFGQVYSAFVTSSGRALEPRLPKVGTLVAVKRIRVQPAALALLKNELRLLKQLDLQYSAKYYGCYIEGDTIYLVMELIHGKDLFEAVFTDRIGLSPEEKVDIALKIALGIAEIHAEGIAHRDIKMENVMLYGENDVKIVDYGLACDFNHPVKETCMNIGGTPGYYDPKVVPGDHESMLLSDWWAFGQLLGILFLENDSLWTERGGYRVLKPIEAQSIPMGLRSLVFNLTDPSRDQMSRPGPVHILTVLKRMNGIV
jgi:serine/threonine protein kinase